MFYCYWDIICLWFCSVDKFFKLPYIRPVIRYQSECIGICSRLNLQHTRYFPCTIYIVIKFPHNIQWISDLYLCSHEIWHYCRAIHRQAVCQTFSYVVVSKSLMFDWCRSEETGRSPKIDGDWVCTISCSCWTTRECNEGNQPQTWPSLSICLSSCSIWSVRY